jgi:ssRNA-specific RNase YbeY (16S rRNA maturation enzyme)
MNEEDKRVMRALEEEILNEYDIKRWKKKTKRLKEVLS